MIRIISRKDYYLIQAKPNPISDWITFGTKYYLKDGKWVIAYEKDLIALDTIEYKIIIEKLTAYVRKRKLRKLLK